MVDSSEIEFIVPSCDAEFDHISSRLCSRVDLASDKKQSEYHARDVMFRPYLLLGIVALGIVLGFTIPFHTNKGIGMFVGWVSATVLARYVVSFQDPADLTEKFGWLSFGFLTLSVVSLFAFLIRWNPTEVKEIDALLFIVCIIFGMAGLSCLWFYALSRLKVTDSNVF